MEHCTDCGSLISTISDRCLTCGADIGAPNVRAARDPAEKSALQYRFAGALARGEARGVEREVAALGNAVGRSSAIVNCELPFLREFVTNPKVLYINYHRGVLAQVRKAAETEFDRERTLTDAIFFGSYSKEIVMAALSLTDTGLSSYGSYSITLREVAVTKRASLLDQNSFSFVAQHSITIGIPIPPGHRSTWDDRGKLAVAKLADRVTAGMNELDFRRLLLNDSGNRNTDEFIEVHIFGTFDRDALQSVCGPKLKPRNRDRAIWEVVKEQLTAINRKFVEI